jgi:hypothetical protein
LKTSYVRLIGVLVLGLHLVCGCGPSRISGPELDQTQLAVAEFINPCDSWQLLAGCLPEDEEPLSSEVLDTLDAILAEELEARKVTSYRGPNTVRQCQEIILFEAEDLDMSGLEFWSRIGRCVPADLLLVPQVFEWRQRQGGEWGADQPARVVFDLFLLDVRQQKLIYRYHCEKEQKSLTEDLFGLGRFFRRGGKWVTAEALAREGMEEGLEALGL